MRNVVRGSYSLTCRLFWMLKFDVEPPDGSRCPSREKNVVIPVPI